MIRNKAAGTARIMTLAALLGSAGLALSACSDSEARESEDEDSTQTSTVERRSLNIRAEAAGLVEPVRVVEVKSKASGEVLTMNVQTGDYVERGALLAEVDPRDVNNEYQQAAADREVAEARLETAQARLARVEELREAGVVTQEEYENAALEAANARAQAVKARTSLQLARERTGDVTVRAPMDGTIIQRDVEAGQIITSGSSSVSGGTTLLLMADLSEMQVRTLIDETDIGRIQPGQTARAAVEAYPNRTFEGSVLKIEPQAVEDESVTMFPVLIALENREGLLRPGMNAEVEVQIARRENVLTVPNAAVVGVQDVTAAGVVLGLSEDEVTEAVRGARGQLAMVPANGPRPGAGGAAARGAGMREGGGSPGARAQRAPGSGDAAPNRVGSDEGDADSDQPPVDEVETRAAFVYVRGPDGPEPRPVRLGVNDWEHTEVVEGLDDGDEVYMISVARLRQQQSDMMDRIRSRSNPFGG